ncbi:hypothetical protein VIGAN_10033200, partial [Vigna angularis var. angularis]
MEQLTEHKICRDMKSKEKRKISKTTTFQACMELETEQKTTVKAAIKDYACACFRTPQVDERGKHPKVVTIL